MAEVWRLASPTYSHALDGEGNRRHGARWNSPGRGVVYCSSNLSLCVLETYANVPAQLRDRLPEMSAVRLRVPDDAGIETVRLEEFQHLISAPDARSACRAVGDRWLVAGAALTLTAPSVIVPEELNVMLNPAHPRMSEVAVLGSRPFAFDLRLAGNRGS